MTRDENQALDLTQEVFLKAHRARRSFRGDSSPLSWLFTIAARCFLDSLRAQPIDKADAIEMVDCVHSDEGVDERLIRHDLVVKLLARAKRDVQLMVMGRYFDELELGQIALLHGVNEKTVRRKLDKFLGDARKTAARMACD